LTVADGVVYLRVDGSIAKFDPATFKVSLVYDASRSGMYISCSGPIASDGQGHLYVTDCHSIVSIDLQSGNFTRIAGAQQDYNFADGAGPVARFNNPQDFALNGNDLYVADQNNNAIRKIALSTGTVSTVAGKPMMCGFAEGTGMAAQFCNPSGLAFDGAGTMYIADGSNNRVRAMTVPGYVVSTFAGMNQGAADGTGTAASFYGPNKLTFDANKQSLLVSDTFNDLLRKIDLGTKMVTTLAGTVGKPAVMPGSLPAQLNQPDAIALAPWGDLLMFTPRENSILQIRY
jgi:sugar lactone lactonase YvrE